MADRRTAADALATDRALREAFRGVARPRLTPFFTRRLLGRLAGRQRRRKVLRRWRRVLQLYWLAAGVGSVLIVFRLPWREHAPAASPVLITAIVCGGLAPIVVLLLALHKDPVDLLFETLDWLS